jgi:hypothetical protein
MPPVESPLTSLGVLTRGMAVDAEISPGVSAGAFKLVVVVVLLVLEEEG